MKWTKVVDLDEWMEPIRQDAQVLPKVVRARWVWHKTAAGRNRQRYAITELAAVGAAAAIPIATTANLDRSIIAILGSIVLVATGIRTTFQLHENWIEHTKVRQGIEREATRFLAGASPYEDHNATQTLILRVENIAYGWGKRWAARRNRHNAAAEQEATDSFTEDD